VKSRQGVTPAACVEDAKSAERWLRQNAARLGLDPNRIVAAGGSAGGHIAACTACPGLEARGMT
jgi:acetyl esterase/lipase